MESIEAQKIISRHRGDGVVVATMSAHYEWPEVSTKPELDFLNCVMGKASSIALGVALARSDKKVILLDGNGSLLMNLGTLVTITNMSPPNLIYFLIDNGCYRCCEPGYDCPGTSKTDFSGFARAAGFPNIHEFEDSESLTKSIENIMQKGELAFVWLRCVTNREYPPYPYVESRKIVDRFTKALQSS